MKKYILLITLLILLTSCSGNYTKLILTTTEFNTIGNENNLNDHFNTKQAVGSNVYEINFKDRDNFSKKLYQSSEKKIVYHDFCKVGNDLYAVGGKFGKDFGTARLVKIDPEDKSLIKYNDSEIRIRDCEAIKHNNKNYISMVSHGEGKLYLYDVDSSETITLNASFKGTIDGKDYTGVTMIHEIITADLNSDNQDEMYYTVTSKNGKTNIDQKGKIFIGEINDSGATSKEFLDLGDAYSKEVHKINILGKDMLLISVQGKTETRENTQPKVTTSFKFKDGTEKKVLDNTSNQDIIRNTVLKLVYLENGKQIIKDLGEINTVQCRTVDKGNLYNKDELNLIVGCNNGLINIYNISDNLKLSLKESFKVDDKQVHSFYVVDTDNNGSQEVFVGIDFDGFYHLDLTKDKKLFKMYDYTKSETWLWAIEKL